MLGVNENKASIAQEDNHRKHYTLYWIEEASWHYYIQLAATVIRRKPNW